MIGQFLIFLSCFIYLDYLYFTNLRPDLVAKKDFVATPCFIMSKKLSTHNGYWKKYRADFLVNYRAGGVQYSRWVSANGLDRSYKYSNSSQIGLLSSYQVGGTQTCYYNPSEPGIAMLAFRSNWIFLAPFVIPLLVGCIALAFFVKSCLRLSKGVRK